MLVTNTVLRESLIYLLKNVANRRELCRFINLQPRTLYLYIHQLNAGEDITMSNSVRLRVYEAALKVKAAEAEALKALKEEN